MTHLMIGKSALALQNWFCPRPWRSTLVWAAAGAPELVAPLAAVSQIADWTQICWSWSWNRHNPRSPGTQRIVLFPPGPFQSPPIIAKQQLY